MKKEMFEIPGSEIAIPVLVDGEEDTVWMTQKQMAVMFDVDRSRITRHIQNIFETAELIEDSVCAENALTASDGKKYKTKHYNLDMIISVGYRINSKIGTAFRKWATQRLKELLRQGYSLNEEKLEADSDKFDKMVAHIQELRRSEKNLYRKVIGGLSSCTDWLSLNRSAGEFYAIIQNKFHYAAHGHTAAELIMARADAKKPRMGLKSWKGKRDVTVIWPLRSLKAPLRGHELN